MPPNKLNLKKASFLALTLKNSSFLFLLKYKAESIFAGMLVKRLGKPLSSLNPVYLHTLSPVSGHFERKERCTLMIF